MQAHDAQFYHLFRKRKGRLRRKEAHINENFKISLTWVYVGKVRRKSMRRKIGRFR
jgi:hypothetical protein